MKSYAEKGIPNHSGREPCEGGREASFSQPASHWRSLAAPSFGALRVSLKVVGSSLQPSVPAGSAQIVPLCSSCPSLNRVIQGRSGGPNQTIKAGHLRSANSAFLGGSCPIHNSCGFKALASFALCGPPPMRSRIARRRSCSVTARFVAF